MARAAQALFYSEKKEKMKNLENIVFDKMYVDR